MKNLFILFAITLCFASKAQSTIKWPSGNATNYAVAVSGTTAVTFTNTMNYNGTIPTLTANITVSVTAGTGIKAGAHMLLTVKTTSTETTTYAGDIVAPVVTGVAGKTWSQGFIYNGTKFYPMGAKIQVD